MSTPPNLAPPSDLVESGPLVRAALHRLHGRPVLLVNSDAAPITSGQLVVTEAEGGLFPTLHLEFSLRAIVFVMEIPLSRAFALAATWTGLHFVFHVPTGARLRLEMPGDRV